MRLGIAASLVLALLCPSIAGAQRSAEQPIRVLLVYGGHDFQEPEFFAFWDALPGVSYTKAPLPASADLLRPGLEKSYDVVVLYDMFTGFTPAQKQGFVDLLKTGIGLVALHHSLGSHRGWDEYSRIIGGKYVFAPEEIDGKHYEPSTYSHDEEVPVAIADPGHFITRDLQPYTIHDEAYGGAYVAPDVHVLLTTDHPRSTKALAWTKSFGPSRVVYYMAGHDAKAWTHPSFRQIVLRSLWWTTHCDDATGK